MRGLIVVAACILPFAALAQSEVPAAPAADGGGFGSQTRLWLSTQAGGANAVTEARPMPGEVATLVYQRYLQSFSYPIPERFSSDSFTAGGSSSAGTGGGSSH
jgi:hypothetical protein